MEDININNIVTDLARYELQLTRSKYENNMHCFSALFEKKMKKVIYYEEFKRKLLITRRAIITVLITVGIISAIVAPDVYVEAAKKIYELYENYYKVQFQENINGNSVSEYELGYIPSGWTIKEKYYYGDMGGTWYINDRNEIIDFSYGLSDSISQINSEEVSYSEIIDNAGRHIYYLEASGTRPSTMQWMSDDETTMFTLAAPLSKDEMIMIISNIHE